MALMRDELASHYGNSFQDLFGRYMDARYGDDFQRVRPAGKLGDGGCDGYKHSTKTVYQCLGKHKSSGVNAAEIVEKITHDFAHAKTTFTDGSMLEWVFVYNLSELPHTAVIAIGKLRDENPSMSISTLGHDGIGRILLEIDETVLDQLFDIENVRSRHVLEPSDVQLLLNRVAQRQHVPLPTEIAPVPLDKIERNELSGYAELTIRDNIKYVAQVARFVRESPDPRHGDVVAAILMARYQELKLQKFHPNEIFVLLVEFVVGDGDFGVPLLKAAEAIVVYFFQTCDVFERIVESSNALAE